MLNCLNRKPPDSGGAAVGSHCGRDDGGVPGVGSVTPRDGGLTVTVMGDEPDAGRSVTRGKRGGGLPHHLLFQKVLVVKMKRVFMG